MEVQGFVYLAQRLTLLSQGKQNRKQNNAIIHLRITGVCRAGFHLETVSRGWGKLNVGGAGLIKRSRSKKEKRAGTKQKIDTEKRRGREKIDRADVRMKNTGSTGTITKYNSPEEKKGL